MTLSFSRKPSQGKRLFRRGLLLFLAGSIVAVSFLLPHHFTLRFDRETAFADGRTVLQASVVWKSTWGTPVYFEPGVVLSLDAAPLKTRVLHREKNRLWIRAGNISGDVKCSATRNKQQVNENIFLSVDLSDTDGDGLPDAAEILTEEDRTAFTSWFTLIAESQNVAVDDAWPAVHQDCAGLIRFAFKEALRVHDRKWLQARRRLLPGGKTDVQVFHYPDIPAVKDKPFVALKAGQRYFSAAPSARSLWHDNTHFISRDVEKMRAGDLLFYHVPYGTGSRMHSMIALGPTSGASYQEKATRVVYHTGASPDEGGEVRVVELQELLAHPSLGWRPTVDNPRFLGVHRLIHLTHVSQSSGKMRFSPKGSSS